MTRADLIAIVNSGASLEVNGTDYTRADLVAIVNALKNDATLTIQTSANMTRADLIAISNAKKGAVIFSL